MAKKRKKTARGIYVTQPPDWVAAWKDRAEAAGKSLSEWIGDACNAQLPASARKKLTERPPAHRPKS